MRHKLIIGILITLIVGSVAAVTAIDRLNGEPPIRPNVTPGEIINLKYEDTYFFDHPTSGQVVKVPISGKVVTYSDDPKPIPKACVDIFTGYNCFPMSIYADENGYFKTTTTFQTKPNFYEDFWVRYHYGDGWDKHYLKAPYPKE